LPAVKADELSPAQASTSPLGNSRLVRSLSALDVAEVSTASGDFAARLAQLIDFSDSIKLSTMHDTLPGTRFASTGLSGQQIERDFARTRKTIVQSVLKTFAPTADPGRIRLPAADAPPSRGSGASYGPYQKFYSAHQRQIDFSTQSLHRRVREAITGLTPELAQLAALDSALSDTLLAQTKKYFAAVPQLLRKRFEQLLDEYHETAGSSPSDPQGWQQQRQQFCHEMQQTLLAEIDTRLLPTLGLIEAINEHEDHL
jgi:hypothetical protein